MREGKAKYHHTVEPIDVIGRDGKTVVVARVAFGLKRVMARVRPQRGCVC